MLQKRQWSFHLRRAQRQNRVRRNTNILKYCMFLFDTGFQLRSYTYCTTEVCYLKVFRKYSDPRIMLNLARCQLLGRFSQAEQSVEPKKCRCGEKICLHCNVECIHSRYVFHILRPSLVCYGSLISAFAKVGCTKYVYGNRLLPNCLNSLYSQSDFAKGTLHLDGI